MSRSETYLDLAVVGTLYRHRYQEFIYYQYTPYILPIITLSTCVSLTEGDSCNARAIRAREKDATLPTI